MVRKREWWMVREITAKMDARGRSVRTVADTEPTRAPNRMCESIENVSRNFYNYCWISLNWDLIAVTNNDQIHRRK